MIILSQLVGLLGGDGPDPGLGAQMAPPTGKSVMFFSSGRQGPIPETKAHPEPQAQVPVYGLP